MSKVFERLVSVRLIDDLWNTVLRFQPPSFLIGKVWVPLTHSAKCIGEWTGRYRIVQIDFSTASDRVNHQEILYTLCPIGNDHSTLWWTVVGVNRFNVSGVLRG